MKKAELLVLLSDQLSVPQPSERWAMYRLIAPIVDYANGSLRLTPYFEFNQTSRHRTHHSHPQVLIEAKRLDRPITPEQIDKYLEGNVRGIVSNGVLWVLCRANAHACLEIYVEGELQTDALNSVVAFIQGGTLDRLCVRLIWQIAVPILEEF